MILGTQWYILFNVIAGASAFPGSCATWATNWACGAGFGGARWRCRAVLPFYLTGAITASGGSWNASIVAEAVSWGDTRLYAQGLGSYIAQATAAGDMHRVVLGIVVMSALRPGHQPRALAAALLVCRAPLPPCLDRRSTCRTGPLLEMHGVRQAFEKSGGGQLLVLDGVDLHARGRRDRGPAWALGLGQVDAAAADRGPCLPMAGTLDYLGAPLSGPAPGIAMVFQSFALFPG